MSDSAAQMLLELRQGWCCDHCPGEPVPVPDTLLLETNLRYLASVLQVTCKTLLVLQVSTVLF